MGGLKADCSLSQVSNKGMNPHVPAFMLNSWLLAPADMDEADHLMLIENRIHWAIKRNIIKDTTSEDLVYAECVKNENEDFFDMIRKENAQ